MIYLVFYDISSDQIRQKVAKRLIADGFERLQLSVLVGLFNPARRPGLWQQLQAWIQADQSGKLYIMACTKQQFSNMETLGNDEIDLSYLLGDKSVIFI